MEIAIGLVILSFILLWIASNLVVDSMASFSKSLKTSSFSSSFIVLGILTSLPELSIGINAVLEKTPAIYVGNLIGATLVLIAGVIPLFAIAGNGVRLIHNLSAKTFLFALFVISLPALASIDHVIERTEGIILIIGYLLLAMFTQEKNSVFSLLKKRFVYKKEIGITTWIQIGIGVILLLAASRMLVENALTIANELHISAFLISLLVFSIGTNTPELFVGIRSIISKKKDVALGNYVGSAAANSLLFGVLALIAPTSNINGLSLTWSAFLVLISITLLYIFARSKNTLSRKEGIALFSVYVLFLCVEIF